MSDNSDEVLKRLPRWVVLIEGILDEAKNKKEKGKPALVSRASAERHEPEEQPTS